jgi:hypothetical protein
MKKSLALAALTALVIAGSTGLAHAQTAAVPLPDSAAAAAVAATSGNTPSAKEAVQMEAKKEVGAKVEAGKDAAKEHKHVKKMKAAKEHGKKKVEKATEAVKDAMEMK